MRRPNLNHIFIISVVCPGTPTRFQPCTCFAVCFREEASAAGSQSAAFMSANAGSAKEVQSCPCLRDLSVQSYFRCTQVTSKCQRISTLKPRRRRKRKTRKSSKRRSRGRSANLRAAHTSATAVSEYFSIGTSPLSSTNFVFLLCCLFYHRVLATIIDWMELYASIQLHRYP